MKEVVLKLELYDEKDKKKAMQAISGLEGLDSFSMDMNDKKLTVTGDIDPLDLAARLRKLCRTEIVSVSVRPAEEGKKKRGAKGGAEEERSERRKMEVVLKLELYDEKCKKKAMMVVSGLDGLDSVSMDMKDKLTVTGDIDPLDLAARLRKLCRTEIVSVRSAKEETKEETELRKAYGAHYPSEEDPFECVIC